ncbi:hypothetical protein FRC06_008966 [Ceratobasidium sp. 370]|nr:hypothetical protein FRC06_008966 [Ceratobasidium sp. 370]
MSLTRSFLNDFRPLFRLLEEPFHAPALTRFNRPSMWHPLALQHQTPVEFSEEGNDVVVRAEVPGVQKEHLDVISQPEFRSSFSRTFWLPQPVNGAKATAELADGILILRIPKREESQGQRIPIA